MMAHDSTQGKTIVNDHASMSFLVGHLFSKTERLIINCTFDLLLIFKK